MVHLLESVKISSTQETEGETAKMRVDSADRSSLHVFDEALRTCYVSVKLYEYRNGKKIREALIMYRDSVNRVPMSDNTEDSAMIFNLIRKQKNDSIAIWSFITPFTSAYEIIRVNSPGFYWPFSADLDWGRQMPLGKPFVFMVFTTPDDHGNYPFLSKANKGKFSVYEWNKVFNLKHTLLVELTIEKMLNEPSTKKKMTTSR